jgi:membrane protease YdiL (CAAX protease family)
MTTPAAAAPRGLWGTLGRATLFVLLYVVAVVLTMGLLAGPLTSVVGWTGQRIRIDEVLSLVAVLAATAIMLRSVDPRPWRDVGLAREAARPRAFVTGWCVGAAPIAAASGTLLVAHWLVVVPATAGSSLAAGVRLSVFLLPAALHEEVLCRGYLLTVLRDSIGVRGAVVGTSVLFGALHVANADATLESVGIVILAGIFLAAVRVVFDSLYAAWAAHFAWNWVMAVPLHAPVSGLRLEAPDYRTLSAGPAWITGGGWGPEGGLAAALGMVAALAYLHARHRRAYQQRPGREES